MKKSHIFNVKLFRIFAVVGFALFFSVFCRVSFADNANIFVEDNANILSNQDKNAIKEINEQDFANLPGSPQFVIVTLENLDGYDSIEDYAEKKFQRLGIGNKDLDNGFLFVISIDDKKYRLETGYGVEDVITDSMKNEVVTDQIEYLLEERQYEQAVMDISKNIKELVTEKYSDIDAAKEVIQKEKERTTFIVKLVIAIVVSIVLLVILGIMYYLGKIKKIQGKLNKQYINKNMMVFTLSHKESTLFGAQKRFEKINLSHHLAKIIFQKQKQHELLSNEASTKEWIGQHLLVDSIISNWCSSKEAKVYPVSVYVDDKYITYFKEKYVPIYQMFSYPLNDNPFSSSELSLEVKKYIKDTFLKHEEALRISKENKRYIERVCELFLSQNKVRLKKIDYQLEVALMVYYFLQDKDLSNKRLLQTIQIDDQTLAKAYQFANKKRKKIANENRRKALEDLTNMTLTNYYMQAIIWSSYNSSRNTSSSFGGRSGGSSFGGGSSGGGGFSGGWK